MINVVCNINDVKLLILQITKTKIIVVILIS